MHAHAAVPQPEVTDAAIIEQVLAGDTQPFALLVRRYNQAMYRACRAILRDDQEAEDAVQTAWLAAYRALATFRADATFRTWVTRIAVNEASARLRQRARRLAALPGGPQEPAVSAPASPEREVLGKQLAALLERELDDLPEGLRSVLVLRDIIELDTAETAACLAIEPENVRVRLHRARQALSQRLAASMEELLSAAMPDVWRFDGDRCARTLARVMDEIAK